LDDQGGGRQLAEGLAAIQEQIAALQGSLGGIERRVASVERGRQDRPRAPAAAAEPGGGDGDSDGDSQDEASSTSDSIGGDAHARAQAPSSQAGIVRGLAPRAARDPRRALLSDLTVSDATSFWSAVLKIKGGATQDERHKWASIVCSEPPKEAKLSMEFAKDLVKVINTLDAAEEALGAAGCTAADATLFSLMANRYLRYYISEEVKRVAADAWIMAGRPDLAIKKLHERERDLKHPISELEVEREERRILNGAKAADYAVRLRDGKKAGGGAGGGGHGGGGGKSSAARRRGGKGSSGNNNIVNKPSGGSGAATPSTGAQN